MNGDDEKVPTQGDPAPDKRLSLGPIPFEEAVSDLMKVKPPPELKRQTTEKKRSKKRT